MKKTMLINTLVLGTVVLTRGELGLNLVSGGGEPMKHEGHYITSDGQHYMLSDGLYYRVKEEG